jgi:hypothetical protein
LFVRATGKTRVQRWRDGGADRPYLPASAQVFCGNFEYDASESSILRMFEKYGRVQRIDMKTGEQQRLFKGHNASLQRLGPYK